jgi:hypothetical protein
MSKSEKSQVTFGSKSSASPGHNPVDLGDVLPGDIFSSQHYRYDDDRDDEGEPLWELRENPRNLRDFLQYIEDNPPTQAELDSEKQTHDNTAANSSSMDIEDFKKKLATHNLVNVQLLRSGNLTLTWEKKPELFIPDEERGETPPLDESLFKRRRTTTEQEVSAETSPTLYKYLSNYISQIFTRKGGKTKRRSSTKRRKTKRRSTTKRIKSTRRRSSKKK